MPILKIEDHPEESFIMIEGVNYSYDLFKAWGENGLPLHQPFEIVKRNCDGVITINKIEKEA